jgi:cytochrome c oxidase cbb3-type subunit 2
MHNQPPAKADPPTWFSVTISARWQPVGLAALLAAMLLFMVGAGPNSDQHPEAVSASRAEPLTRVPDIGEYMRYNQRASLIDRGRRVYSNYCIGCHGANGDGKGPAATRLLTQPRDFTRGIFKFRSTDSSSLPLETDLHRTITRGLARVSMPAFPLMSERDRVAVIEYIKTFYPHWEEEQSQRKKVFVPEAPADLDDPQRILRGRVVFVAMQCWKCHGIDGAGTGATQTEYIDAWGNPQKPFNFTRGRLKGGDDPEDIYRTFHTGLRSIMPSYGGTTLAMVNQQTFAAQVADLPPGEAERLAPVVQGFPESGADVFNAMDEPQRRELAQRNSWDLVAYVLSLRRTPSPPPEGPPQSLSESPPVAPGPLPAEPPQSPQNTAPPP